MRSVREVTQRNADCVGCVDRSDGSVDLQQAPHHALHLRLVGGAVSGHGLLDRVGRVLSDVGTAASGLSHDHPGGLSDPDGGADVDLEQDAFEGDHVNGVLGEQLAHVVGDGGQAIGHRVIGRGAQHAHGVDMVLRGATFDHAIAAARQPRVDPENEHGFDATRSAT